MSAHSTLSLYCSLLYSTGTPLAQCSFLSSLVNHGVVNSTFSVWLNIEFIAKKSEPAIKKQKYN